MNILQHKEKNKFTLTVENELATIYYKIENKKVYLISSEVPYSFRDRGLGKSLIKKIYKKLIEQGLKPIAVCRYIKAVVRKNNDKHS